MLMMIVYGHAHAIRNLTEHMCEVVKMESKMARLSCNYCSQTYAFKSGLSRHLAKHHTLEVEESKYNIQCESCGSRYAIKTTLFV